jgi:hypothetical protein
MRSWPPGCLARTSASPCSSSHFPRMHMQPSKLIDERLQKYMDMGYDRAQAAMGIAWSTKNRGSKESEVGRGSLLFPATFPSLRIDKLDDHTHMRTHPLTLSHSRKALPHTHTHTHTLSLSPRSWSCSATTKSSRQWATHPPWLLEHC